MSTLCRWMADAACRNWDIFTDKHLGATFMDMPQDVFVYLCELLAVRDILALRMTNKVIAASTRDSTIWSFLLRRLLVPLPILPATSRYAFGTISPSTYEWLMRRALYLEQNWRRPHPLAAHSRFQAFGRTIVMRMVSGGRYMVSVTKNPEAEKYTLVLWDMDQAGARVPLAGAISDTPFLKLEVTYALVNGCICIAIAYAKPPIKRENVDSTEIRVVSLPLCLLEEFAERPRTSSLSKFAYERPFSVLHESWTSCDVGQLVLDRIDNQLVLLVVHRPRALVLHYLESGQRGSLLLGPVRPYDTLMHSIWAVKLMSYQNTVLVGRVLVEVGMKMDSTLFALDMFLLPGPGSSYKYPTPIGRQFISGLHIDGFYFSNREASWFANLHDPESLLPAPANRSPPPLSIFVTTRKPRGFVQCLLRPIIPSNEALKQLHGRAWMTPHTYQLPAVRVERQTWDDEYARPVVLPGAYRSIIFLRPHMRPELQREGAATAGSMEILRFCAHATKVDECKDFATPRTTAHPSSRIEEPDDEMMEVDEGGHGISVAMEAKTEWRKPSFCPPVIPETIAWKMMEGTTSIAFDESIGKLCVAVSDDTDIHVLDFGGENWEVAVVDP